MQDVELLENERQFAGQTRYMREHAFRYRDDDEKRQGERVSEESELYVKAVWTVNDKKGRKGRVRSTRTE